MTEPELAPLDPSDDAVTIAQAVFQDWQQGSQASALERLRMPAERQEVWAVAFLSWLYMQQGVSSYPSASDFALRAARLGSPWMAALLMTNVFANLAGNPQLEEVLPDLMQSMPWGWSGVDPVGQAWSLLSQGRADVAVRIMAIHGPYPGTAAAWDNLSEHAAEQLRKIEQHLTASFEAAAKVQQQADESGQEITRQQQSLETAAKQAGLLVSSVNSDAVNKLFKADAERRQTESQEAWRWGLGILAAAAVVAVLPLFLHYVGAGPDFTSNGLLLAHATSTAALGTVAGVLLARSRGRDRGAQRASDLSTAMGTMIAYSNQISDEAEKQKFMLTMGQLVLQAHLQADSGAKEDVGLGLAALVTAIRGGS